MADRWNTSIPFNTDNYLVRLTKASFGPSSKGSPMITIESEILSPETINVAGVEYVIAGQFVSKLYLVTKSINEQGEVDVDKTEKIKKRLDSLCKKLNIPTIENPDNPDVSVFEGKIVWALLEDSPNEKRKALTKEQLDRGERLGDVIINPMTGQPVITHYPKFGQVDNEVGIYGVPSEDVIKQAMGNRPY